MFDAQPCPLKFHIAEAMANPLVPNEKCLEHVGVGLGVVVHRAAQQRVEFLDGFLYAPPVIAPVILRTFSLNFSIAFWRIATALVLKVKPRKSKCAWNEVILVFSSLSDSPIMNADSLK